jgi:hypothetical protein
MKLLKQKELHVAMTALTKSTVATRQMVQDMAHQAVGHSIVHGDTSIGKMLLEAIGVNKSLRKDSLIAYLEKYGNFAWVKLEKTLKFRATYPVGKITPEHEALFLAAKWDEAKREQDATSVYDMEALFRAFIAKQEKLCLDANVTVKNRDVLQAVSDEFARINAIKVLATIKPMTKAETKVAKGKAIDAALKPKPMTNREALVQKLKDEAAEAAVEVPAKVAAAG